MPIKKQKDINYAVVGLGWFAQEAILPAFKNAKNSKLVALVSGDAKKRNALARKYKIKDVFDYDQYDELLRSGTIDAVYIALPNDQHKDFAIRATQAGIHVLCEKPLALTSRDCEAMSVAAHSSGVKLMTAYRLHFEESNLKAVEIARSGKIGDPRIFNSTFSFPVKKGNIRTRPFSEGGGPLFDIGVYCINAARYLFQDEPHEVFGWASGRDRTEVEGPDTYSVIMKFAEDRVAQFTVSYAVSGMDYYELIGTKGSICAEDGYSHVGGAHHWLTVGEKTQEKQFKKRDQVGPEIQYFSECIIKDREPEPSGLEGLADVRVIEAIAQSIDRGMPIRLEKHVYPGKRPTQEQEIVKPKTSQPGLVRARDPQKKAA